MQLAHVAVLGNGGCQVRPVYQASPCPVAQEILPATNIKLSCLAKTHGENTIFWRTSYITLRPYNEQGQFAAMIFMPEKVHCAFGLPLFICRIFQLDSLKYAAGSLPQAASYICSASQCISQWRGAAWNVGVAGHCDEWQFLVYLSSSSGRELPEIAPPQTKVHVPRSQTCGSSSSYGQE